LITSRFHQGHYPDNRKKKRKIQHNPLFKQVKYIPSPYYSLKKQEKSLIRMPIK